MNWRPLTERSQLQELRELSAQEGMLGVVLFKHSTRCSISSAAKARLESSWSFSDETLPAYYLDLIRYREVSNAIAAEFDVVHESPQLILLQNGSVAHHASHFQISIKPLAELTSGT